MASTISTVSSAPAMVNLGIIGMGHRAESLAKVLLRDHPEYRLVAVYDSYTPIIEKMKREDTSGVLYTSSYDEFFSAGPTTVMVAPINAEHYTALQQCLSRGVNIFCEKPVVATLEELKLFKSPQIAEYPGTLVSGLVLRHSKFYQKIKEVLPEIGKVKSMLITDHLHYGHGAFIITNWRRHKSLSGGHINEKSVHMIDLIQWWLGMGVPTEINAMGTRSFWKPENHDDGEHLKLIHHNPDLFSQYVVHEKMSPYCGDGDIEDNISVTMKFGDDVLVTLHAVTHCPDSQRHFSIIGTRGKIDALWEHNTGKIQVIYSGGRGSKGEPAKITEYLYPKMGCHGNGDEPIMDSLVSCVRDRIRCDPSFTAAVDATETALRIEELLRPQLMKPMELDEPTTAKSDEDMDL